MHDSLIYIACRMLHAACCTRADWDRNDGVQRAYATPRHNPSGLAGLPGRHAGQHHMSTPSRPCGQNSSTRPILRGARTLTRPLARPSLLLTSRLATRECRQAPGDELLMGFGCCRACSRFGRSLRDLFDNCASRPGRPFVSQGFWKGLETFVGFPPLFLEVYFAQSPLRFSHTCGLDSPWLDGSGEVYL